MQLSIKENRKKSALRKGSVICPATKKNGGGGGGGAKIKTHGSWKFFSKNYHLKGMMQM